MRTRGVAARSGSRSSRGQIVGATTSRREPVGVLVYASDAAEYAPLVRAPRAGVNVHAAATPLEAARVVADADVLFAWKFPAELYAKAGRLRWLQLMGAGVDSALVPELPSHVTVTRAPGVFGPWMTEYVLAWCLWVTQRIERYREAQRDRAWSPVMPERLGGKTLAVVGLGDIGRAIARGAADLGMTVIGVSRSGRRVRGVGRVYRTSALTRALADADFVVLVAPLTAATRGMIGPRELGAMRQHAWLINVGRGALVDEAALVEALTRHRIAGAILDVFATEPLPADHALWGLDNVVITPHIAGPSTPAEITPIFNDNLRRYLSGRPLRHVVDRARGY